MEYIGEPYIPNEFENLQLIGSGSSSIVYQAHSKKHNLLVVIKVLDKITNKESNILSEISILNKLHSVDNKGIVHYIGFKEDDKNFYIIMEYLRDYILLSTYIATTTITGSIFFKIAENLKIGMIMYHNHGVAHRDIKPENIMIDPHTLNIKYIDFGFACCFDVCYAPHIVGTPLYHAPELSLNDKFVPQNLKQWFLADYWSLGVTMLEIILKQPFIDYYSKKIFDKIPEEYDDIINANKILSVEGVTVSDIEDCCHNFCGNDQKLMSYIKMTLTWLLKGNPKHRALIINKNTNYEKFVPETVELITF